MLRALLINPLIVFGSAAVGFVACRLAHLNPHVPQMLIASGICLFAAEMGLLPLLRHRNAPPATTFQAAFIGSVLHLGVTAVLAIVVMLSLKPGTSFVFWLLAMYWLTLIGLCTLFVKKLRTPVRPMGTASI